MGTEIDLKIGEVSISWSKNSRGIDHGSLFQEKDIKKCISDQIDYSYFEESGEDPSAMEEALIRPLREIVPRLELLGFSLDRARKEFEYVVEEYNDIFSDDETKLSPMNFDEFLAFATQFPIKSLENNFISECDEPRVERIQGRFHGNANVKRLPYFYNADGYSEASYFGELITIIHPHLILRILAEKKENLDVDVIWQYGPLVDAGWASRSEFNPGTKRDETFLVATEGSSDTYILKHAFSILRPDVADFFKVIDVEKSHPFSGTGNLVRFAEGLIRIDVLNNAIFLFDNDAEGFEAYQKLKKISLPPNIGVVTLPELDEFLHFKTRGPNGISYADINRRAAAIECYLDLDFANKNPPVVTWTTYKKSLDMYHGSLDRKETYTKRFLKQTPETIQSPSYEIKKIQNVLETLINECRRIAGKTCDFEKIRLVLPVFEWVESLSARHP